MNHQIIAAGNGNKEIEIRFEITDFIAAKRLGRPSPEIQQQLLDAQTT